MLSNFGEVTAEGAAPVWIWVPGLPVTQGSVDFYDHAVGVRQNLRTWRERIATCVRATLPTGAELPYPQGVAVGLELLFVLYRPVRTPRRSPTPDAVKRPDLDKLIRAVGDALTGVLYHDDPQIRPWIADKRIAEFGEQPGLYLRHFPSPVRAPGPPAGAIVHPSALVTAAAARDRLRTPANVSARRSATRAPARQASEALSASYARRGSRRRPAR